MLQRKEAALCKAVIAGDVAEVAALLRSSPPRPHLSTPTQSHPSNPLSHPLSPWCTMLLVCLESNTLSDSQYRCT